MKVNCLFCGNQIFLNHKIFFNDEGAVKCFCCGATVDIETAGKTLSVLGAKNTSRPPALAAVQPNH